MGLGLFASLLYLSILVGSSVSQQPNTDGYYVSDFLQKMGIALTSLRSDPNSSVCSWKRVSCDTQWKRHVTSLEVSGLGLHGVIPDDTLGKLSMLEHLDLSNNGVSGLSSDFWGLGGSLKTLNLSFNIINGSLPNNIGNFRMLEELDLSHNQLVGEIPSTIGSLSSLKVLNLSSNSFRGRIPNGILGCRSLVDIDLSSNGLNASLPDGLGSALKDLNTLNLALNAISGRVPDFSGLESISYLNLSGNMFQGSVLNVLNRPLQVADLSNNQFQGHISQVFPSSSFHQTTLIYLDISGNHINGDSFGDLNEVRSLKHLNLASNSFSLHEFPRLGNLTSLKCLNLSRTELTGRIPSDISSLLSLKILDLSHNHLTGHIPELSIRSLDVLDLSWNNLTGEISPSLRQKLPGMSNFNFSYNNLTLCSARFSHETLNSAFLGMQNDCPIAVNPNHPEKKGRKHFVLKIGLAIALSALLVIIGIACFVFGCKGRTRKLVVKQLAHKEEPNISGPFSFQTDSTTWIADIRDAASVPVVIFEKPLLNFTFADLLSATSNFDRGTLLAEGRFGPVYRGFLHEGIHVAIKVLVHNSTSTDHETAMEIERLGHIKHPNLVPLTGYCIAGDQRIAIYEYMENGSLQNLLHDLPLGIQAVENWSSDTWEDDNDGVRSITSEGHATWRFRHKIALGSARALAFLHHGCFPQIIHRDVKASSIYLDSALEPRLSDFGLFKIMGSVVEDGNAHSSPGYTPPEFCQAENSSVTTKSDVYGFGVILFELITGKKPIGDEYPEGKDDNLVSWMRGLVRKNEISKAIDAKLWGTGSEKQMEEALRIGYLCTAELPYKRPSMQQIVGLLKDIEPGVVDQ